MNRFRVQEEGGFSLVFAMAWLVMCCTLVSAMIYTARLTLEMRIRQLDYLHAYAISYAAANAIYHSPDIGTHPCDAVRQDNLAGMTIGCLAHVAKRQTSVQIAVSDGSVVDTISFTYDTIAHRITSWQDNGPGF